MAKTRSKRSTAAPSAARRLRDLLRAQPSQACYDDVVSVAKRLYNDLGTPVAIALRDALEKGDVEYIANATINHKDYSSVDGFYVDYCAVSFLRKWNDLGNAFPSGLDPERRAIETFYRAEALCRSTNDVFSSYCSGETLPTADFANILLRARRIIKNIIGKKPSWEKLRPKFGPGATSACVGESVTIADKLIAFPECTIDALPLVRGLQKLSPAWFHLLAELHPDAFKEVTGFTDDFGDYHITSAKCCPLIVPGNKFRTVDKTAKTKRGICIEPHTNSIFQLALGTELTRLLDKAGLPKAVLQQVHRRLAREFSLTGEYATIDLSMASDTIAYYLVKYLLPEKWFEVLAMFRSDRTLIEGSWVPLEKFSSMGNGYTFELETLIFYALARATADEVGLEQTCVSSYGDDLIIHRDVVKKFYEVLTHCGFIVNEDKSFCNEGFNESCGGDFFKGHDVRPYFLTESPNDPVTWLTVVNGIRRMAAKNSHHGGLDPRFVGAWLRAIAHIPKPLRFHGPAAEGDMWIHTTDVSRWTGRYRSGVWKFRALIPMPYVRKWERYCPLTVYTCALYGAESVGLPLRGGYRRLSVKWTYEAVKGNCPEQYLSREARRYWAIS